MDATIAEALQGPGPRIQSPYFAAGEDCEVKGKENERAEFNTEFSTVRVGGYHNPHP